MLDIRKIKETIDEIIEREDIDRSHLYGNGAIFYFNGNDGTDFDYECNNMTCEFFVFWKSEDGAIKLNQRGDKLDIFVYPEEDPFGGDYKEYEFNSPFELLELCKYLKGSFDDKDIYDEEIKKWILTEEGYISDEDSEDDEW